MMDRTTLRKLYESRITRTVLLLVLLGAFLLPSVEKHMLDNSFFHKGDDVAREHTDTALKRAVIAYGLARATNAIISVFQESEVSIQPAGIGATVAIFQALDPLNDLIERFSSVMLWVIVSLGIQRFLIGLAPWLCSKLIVLGLLACVVGLWSGRHWSFNAMSAGKKLIVFAVALRFIMPFVTLANESVYRVALAGEYESSFMGAKADNREIFGEMGDVDRLKVLQKKELELSKKELTLLGMKSQQGAVRDIFNDTDEVDRLEAEVARLKAEIQEQDQGAEFTTKTLRQMNPLSLKIREKVDGYVEKFINLLTIFFVNTIVFPLLFLWGGLKGVTLLLGSMQGRAHAGAAGEEGQ